MFNQQTNWIAIFFFAFWWYKWKRAKLFAHRFWRDDINSLSFVCFLRKRFKSLHSLTASCFECELKIQQVWLFCVVKYFSSEFQMSERWRFVIEFMTFIFIVLYAWDGRQEKLELGKCSGFIRFQCIIFSFIYLYRERRIYHIHIGRLCRPRIEKAFNWNSSP